MNNTTITGRGADAIVRALEDRRVDTIFGMCGHGSLALLDAIEASDIRFVSVHHEQVAVHAADAYFRVTGRPGVVVTTCGAGAFNTTTGLADAYLDSSAVLVISGAIPSRYAGLGAYQEIDLHGDDEQVMVTRPLVKRAFAVTEPLGVGVVVGRAYYETLVGCPGPVHVHVPLDFMSTEGTFTLQPPLDPPRPSLAAETVDAIADRLARAERPVVLVGGGVTTARAAAELLRVAEAGDIPVVTSMLGQGALPESHPLALGFVGVVGTRPANYAIHRADVVLAIGTRFDEMDTSSWRAEKFFDTEASELIQIDIDARQLGRHYPVTIGAVADAREALGQLAPALEQLSPSHSAWRTEIEPICNSWSEEVDKLRADESMPLQPPAILQALRAVLPKDAVLISGVGVRHLVGQHFDAELPATMLVASGLSTMGWENGAAVGAKVGSGDSPVVALVGDGSFNSTVSAFPTAVAYGINVLWVILDNGGYQSIAAYQDRHFNRRLGTDFERANGDVYQIDYVALARAYGADGESVGSIAELGEAVERGLGRGNYIVHVPTHNRPRAAASGQWDVNAIMSGEDPEITPALLDLDRVQV